MKTKRLGFSCWSQESLPCAMELWGSPEVTKFISADGKMSAEQVSQRLKNEIENQKLYGIQYWPIYVLETGELAGCCGLRPYDSANNILELGVHLKKDYWGQSLATEACQAVLGYAFSTLGASALFAGHHPNNAASAQMLKRLGFEYMHDEFYPPTGLCHPSYQMTKQRFMSLHQLPMAVS